MVSLKEKLPKGCDPRDEANYSRFHQIDYAPDLMFTELTKFVERNHKKPFVLFWTTPVPHVSLQYGDTWPNHIKKGIHTALISGFQDMMPTFCEIAGVNCPPTDGISLLPTLLSKKQEQQHEYLYWEFPEYDGQKAVRMGKWKSYVDNIIKGNRHIELYDLSIDPREHTVISRYHPDIIAKVKAIFKEDHTDAEIKKFNLPW